LIVRPAPSTSATLFRDGPREEHTAMPESSRTVLTSTRPRPTSVAIVAADAVTGQGTAALLHGRDGVRVLNAGLQSEADVFLLLADRVTEDTFRLMERLALGRDAETVRFVLVGDGVREPGVVWSITGGLVTVIPRQEAEADNVARAVARPGDGAVPASEVSPSWLIGQLRMMQQDLLEPADRPETELEPREIAVLRLLADGWGTPEIAVRLAYSERTVKNIIHGVLTRFRLQNRTQAVAFAMRSGVL
jgi:DNA-binding NarL/FixJ family response regulator